MPAPPVAEPTPEQMLLRLEWHVVRRLDGLLQGESRTLFHGAGVDFADLREYQPGDDTRYIDWNVTARMHTPYIREYLEDRDLTAWMLLDRSPSMAFGGSGRTKGNVLTEVVTTIAHILTRRGNRVGAILYDNAVEEVVPPGGGRRHVLRLTRSMMRPPLGSHAETDLAGLLRAGMNTIKRRSLVFLISDFLGVSGWERALPLLSRTHEVIAIRIRDPREVELPRAGLMVLEDSETGEQIVVDTGDPALRRRLEAVAADREARLQTAFRQGGVDAFDVSTDDDLVSALVRIAQQRKGARRR